MLFGEISIDQVTGFLLVLLRTSALILAVPFFNSNNVPTMVKAGLSLSVALLLAPVVKLDPALLPRDMWQLSILAVSEFMIGFILGLMVRMLLTAVQIMGQLAGFQMGFSVANVLDPVSGSQVSVVGQFGYVMVLLVFLSVGGHHWFFTALADSFRMLPPGDFGLSRSLFDQVVGGAADMFSLAIRIGAPVIAALLFTQVGMGILAKSVPQMNILIVGFPLTISVGLIFLSLTLVVAVPAMARIFSELGPVLLGLIKAM